MTIYHNILLIEDDIDDRDFFLEIVKEIDPTIQCTTALNGCTVVELLGALPRFRTIVFLDLNLPMLSGLEVLDIIRADKAFKGIPVVMLTTSKSEQETCTRHGANLYVVKPNSIALFHQIMSVILSSDVVKECEFVNEYLKDIMERASPSSAEGEINGE